MGNTLRQQLAHAFELQKAGRPGEAEAAFKEGILKRDKNTDMPVIIDGTRHGNTIKVESVRGHRSDTSVH